MMQTTTMEIPCSPLMKLAVFHWASFSSSNLSPVSASFLWISFTRITVLNDGDNGDPFLVSRSMIALLSISIFFWVAKSQPETISEWVLTNINVQIFVSYYSRVVWLSSNSSSTVFVNVRKWYVSFPLKCRTNIRDSCGNKDFDLINFSNDQFLSKLLQFEKISNLRKYISTFNCYKSIYCRTCDVVDILTFLIAISGLDKSSISM